MRTPTPGPCRARPHRALLIASFLSLAFHTAPLRAEWDARFAPFFIDSADPATLHLDGPINARSALAFSRVLDELGAIRTLRLSSPGGDVYSALVIAREVDRRGLSTVIPSGAGCFSACAYLYLAGHDRQALGPLGVHQISSEDPDLVSGQVAISDIVEILAEFEVSSDLLVVMLRTAPGDMYVFTPSEMQVLGLVGSRSARGVEPEIAEDASSVTTESEAAEAQQPTPESRALDFVAAYNQLWSRENVEALPGIRTLYAENIEFYGSTITIDEVMAEKETFAERWTVRDYSLDLSVSTAACTTPMNCLVNGEVNWDARMADGMRRSVGRAQVFIGLEERNGEFRIVREDSRVISRE